MLRCLVSHQKLLQVLGGNLLQLQHALTAPEPRLQKHQGQKLPAPSRGPRTVPLSQGAWEA